MITGFPDIAEHTPLWLGLAATGAGAIQGTLLGRSRPGKVDLLGVIILAVCLGFGGGLIRDILLGNLPPAALKNGWYAAIVLACVLIGLVLGTVLDKITSALVIADAATLGLFAAVGTEAALSQELPAISAVIVGTVASIGGGIAASLLIREQPMSMRPGPPYAVAAVAGSVAYVIVDPFLGNFSAVVCIATVFLIRVITYYTGYKTRAIASNADQINGM